MQLDNRVQQRCEPKEFINLFAGLVWNGIDDSVCHIYQYHQRRGRRKVVYRRFISNNYKAKEKGACRETFDIHVFELAFLPFLTEVDLPRDNANPAVTELTASECQAVQSQKANCRIAKEDGRRQRNG